MDFIPDKEFHPMFDRISRVVDLKGVYSVDEVNERLEQTVRDVRDSERAERLRMGRAGIIERNLIKLRDGGFGRRVIREASEKPKGIVALTLKYGRETAKYILLKRAKKRIGTRQTRVSRRKHRPSTRNDRRR